MFNSFGYPLRCTEAYRASVFPGQYYLSVQLKQGSTLALDHTRLHTMGGSDKVVL